MMSNYAFFLTGLALGAYIYKKHAQAKEFLAQQARKQTTEG